MSEEVYRKLESGDTPIDIYLIDILIEIFNLPKVAKKIAYDPRKPAYSHQFAKFRIKAGLTQEAVANYLGVAQGTYAGYESGRREPDIKTLTALAEKYETSVDILIGHGVPLKEIAYFYTKRDSEYDPDTPSDYTDEEYELYRPKK
jgi:transcriptional regulator with XRE-family HTH domain